MRPWAARLATLLATAALAACAPPDPAERYERWRETNAAASDAYFAYLRQHGVDRALPPQQLLRSGRRWRWCGAEEFAVPPQAQWPAMVPTLRLVRELRGAGLLGPAIVASAYREPSFNRCEGGAERSKHTTNAALDFDLTQADAAQRRRLCDYWRQQGAARRFGLGFYADDAIHIDTAGHRTWGYDYTRRSSLCAPPPKPSRIGESKPHRRG
ncbi:D-Ala-D-Ala carboxypeptidase family metallohydrolase [Lysobacter sp. Root604]|uniref:D-Ala-D-Ala carboxypeptidase family metallohydrolase n=1 Tax=Lysobacter sp. Root604 TaxID=1736568 RepID=UPI0006FCDD75|nr:D-Ala-D-Ala carboxypeptidase family metallohydrolase [Lysobacter sp. Root604]KRA20001.1 hypothetical protein ASD69_01185 [Lysobacter sp. Root604]